MDGIDNSGGSGAAAAAMFGNMCVGQAAAGMRCGPKNVCRYMHAVRTRVHSSVQ
jgi:hypothetical protein